VRLVAKPVQSIPRYSLSALYEAWCDFASKSYRGRPFLLVVAAFRRRVMALFDFAGTGIVHQRMAGSSVEHLGVPDARRRRRRALLELKRSLVLLTGIGIGVLMICFGLVLAHSVPQ
jgi:hypothetical protein